MPGTLYNARGLARSPGAESTVTYDSSTALSSKVLNLTTEGDIDWVANIGAPTYKRLGGRWVRFINVGSNTGALSGWGFSSVSFNANDVGYQSGSGTITNGYYVGYAATNGCQISFRLKRGINVVRLYVSNALPFTVDAAIDGSTSTATVTTSAGSGNLAIQFTFNCKEEGQVGSLTMLKTSSSGNMAISAITIGSA